MKTKLLITFLLSSLFAFSQGGVIKMPPRIKTLRAYVDSINFANYIAINGVTGASNQFIGYNNAGNGLEWKSLLPGSNITITPSMGGYTIASTASGGSGSINYISKFTSTTVLGNSQVFDDGTNVGIGINPALQKLHVLSAYSYQLRLGYDATKYVDIGVGSNGTANFGLTGGSIFSFNGAINTGSLITNNIATASTGINANLFINDGLGVFTTTPGRHTIFGAAYSAFRVSIGGSGGYNATLNNTAYETLIVPNLTIGVASGVNLPIATQLALSQLGISGAGTVGINTTFYAAAPSAFGTYRYSGYFGGDVRIDGKTGFGGTLTPSTEVDITGALTLRGISTPPANPSTNGGVFWIDISGAKPVLKFKFDDGSTTTIATHP